jgi:hypothetical protein
MVTQQGTQMKVYFKAQLVKQIEAKDYTDAVGLVAVLNLSCVRVVFDTMENALAFAA